MQSTNRNHASRAGATGVTEALTAQLPDEALTSKIDFEIEEVGGPFLEKPEFAGAVGRTMFDLPQSKDNVVPVLLPRDMIERIPSQSLVCIRSLSDNREYQGIVVEGPFHDPDGLRADAPIVITTTVRGASFMPNYHGRVMVEIIGEIVRDGDDSTVLPARFRPLPNSPVWVLDVEQTATALQVQGDLTLGVMIGHADIEVCLPSQSKQLLPRHVGVLGTTGGGKSTSIANLVNELQRSKTAVVLFDTEGEYTTIDRPTTHPQMQRILARRGKQPAGVRHTQIAHLVGRETSNPDHARVTPFTLRFSDLSPYAVMAILDFNEPQKERFMQAYELAKRALYNAGVYPQGEEQKAQALEIDDFDCGYPHLTLDRMYDIVRACQTTAAKEENLVFFDPVFREKRAEIEKLIKGVKFDSVPSWRVVQGRLNTLKRLRIFDNPTAKPLNFEAMTRPGNITIVDLSGTDSTQVNNLVIASVLRGLLEQQETNAKRAEKSGEEMRRVSVIIEEAHEFLSAERVTQMPELFNQVARIARRGRKRWLGLIFVTQLPQHLPDEVLGLINSHILHKIGDANVISRLKRSIGGVDNGLWDRLPNLAPGQAIVAAPTLSRALLVTMDAAPCQLRLVE